MDKYLFKGFKYKGKNYVIISTGFEKLNGFKHRPRGEDFEILVINSNLPARQKQLELHGLLTERGLKEHVLL